jgi:hypothetical protein
MQNIVEKSIEMNIIVVDELDDFNALTMEQKEIFSIVFEKVKTSVESIMMNMSHSGKDISNHITIMQIISSVITIVEGLTMKTILGIDKKAVALACGRKCIKMMNDHLDMLLLYDILAEQTIEIMIEVSRTLHTKGKKTECCMDCVGRF